VLRLVTSKTRYRATANSSEVIEKMERETGFEPATSSLGKRLSIDNKDNSVFVDLVLAIETTQFSF
jgi:hypothetical protein